MPDARGAAGPWIAVAVWVPIQLTATTLPASSLPDIGGTIYSGGHFVMYGVLGALVARAMLRSGRAARALALAWPLLVLFGALDEWHQRFIPTRSPSVGDLVMDAVGAALGLWCGAVLLRTRWAAWLR